MSVGGLLHREGRTPQALDRPVTPRGALAVAASRRGALARRGAIVAGTLLAAGSILGGATLVTTSASGPAPRATHGVGVPGGAQTPVGTAPVGTAPVGTAPVGTPGALDRAAAPTVPDAGAAAPRSWTEMAFPTAAAPAAGSAGPAAHPANVGANDHATAGTSHRPATTASPSADAPTTTGTRSATVRTAADPGADSADTGSPAPRSTPSHPTTGTGKPGVLGPAVRTATGLLGLG